MAENINIYLKNLSYKFFLNPKSTELSRIEKSINNLKRAINNDLEGKINRIFVFGSYDRRTILPRKYDKKSDIDIIVIFNHINHDRTPETYRIWLKRFADNRYKNRYESLVAKSFPTIVIGLNNINYDLVPAKEVKIGYEKKIYIPDSDSEWIQTDPYDVKTKLTKANTEYNSIVKPIIRLLKAWNCNNGYPYNSYKLELKITEMCFAGDDVQAGFEYAVNMLSSDTLIQERKLKSLRYNVNNMKECLEKNQRDKAKNWLHKILPRP